MTSSRYRWAFWALFIAILATVISLGAHLAHLFELPNKMGMDRDAYFTTQMIYNGWSQFAWPLMVELLAILAGIWTCWPVRSIRLLLFVALAGLVISQVLFWTYTFPANGATGNWTEIPDNWEALRAQWEYSHAGGAVCQLIAVAALALAALKLPARVEAKAV